MRLGFVALALVWCIGCHSDGPGLCPSATWCDGDRLMRCEARCKSEVDCRRIVSVAVDCAAAGERLGVATTCGEITTSNNSDVETCIDAERIACDPARGGTPECSPVVPQRSRYCQATPDGHFWQTNDHGCTDGQLCHPTSNGVFCYTPPGEPCAGGTPNTCDPDGKTLIQCLGTPEAGHVISRFECPSRCGESDTGQFYCMT